MKILLCHNFYQYRGGEDESFTAEVQLLKSYGHEVITYTVHNKEVADRRWWTVAPRAIWNQQTYREVRAVLQERQPAVMHCTNTFPQLSPSIYYAARRGGVPVVQSLRNYRLLCLNGQLFRNGEVCESCLRRGSSWPGVLRGCYRESRAASGVVATMLGVHRALRTWMRAVDLYVAPTEFARQKLVTEGLPADRVLIKPNFVSPDPGVGDGTGGYAVFAGRLSPEKGLGTLLTAWSQIRSDLRLKIVGDGPLADHVRLAASKRGQIEALGRRSLEDVYAIIGGAAVLVMPSEWFETFGRTIVEAFAKGTPVIAARRGAMAELVDEGRTGLLFEPGDAAELSAKVDWMMDHRVARAAMRRAARAEFEAKYTAAKNHEYLMRIYEQAVANYRRAVSGSTEPAVSSHRGEAERASRAATSRGLDSWSG